MPEERRLKDKVLLVEGYIMELVLNAAAAVIILIIISTVSLMMFALHVDKNFNFYMNKHLDEVDREFKP